MTLLFRWKNVAIAGIMLGMTACSFLPDETAPKPTAGFVVKGFGENDVLRETVVTLKNKTYAVKIADKDFARAQGLMFVPSMPSGSGMLFVFDRPSNWGFYMRNTLIPLDIIWINEDKKIVEIATMQPCKTQTCPTHTPKAAAKWVLELNAGQAAQIGAKVGDRVGF